jgi:hypothetical protein
LRLLGLPLLLLEVFFDEPMDEGYDCDIPPLNKDAQSQPGSLRGAITEVMTHNTSHTRIKHIKCSES